MTVAVFAWAMVEPRENQYEFSWLDRAMDLLHDAHIRVDLATATASPPAWFARRYPQTRLVDANGVRREFGARTLALRRG